MRIRTPLADAAVVLAAATAAEAKTFKWAFQGDVQSLDPHDLNETSRPGSRPTIPSTWPPST